MDNWHDSRLGQIQQFKAQEAQRKLAKLAEEEAKRQKLQREVESRQRQLAEEEANRRKQQTESEAQQRNRSQQDFQGNQVATEQRLTDLAGQVTQLTELLAESKREQAAAKPHIPEDKGGPCVTCGTPISFNAQTCPTCNEPDAGRQVRQKREEEARRRKEEEARRRKEEEARRRKEAEARRRKEEEARRRKERRADAKRKAEELRKARAKLLRWEFETGHAVLSSPAIGSDGTVYVGANDPDEKKLYAINGKTGDKLWEFKTGGNVGSSPAIGSDGTVYVGSDDKKLYAFRTDSKGLAKSPWPMRGQNARHRGRVIK